MKIYTRTGDRGTTALFGGDRVVKHHPRIAAYGTVDEANTFLGLARAYLHGAPGEDILAPMLERLQADLFVLGADLATPDGARPSVPRIDPDHSARVEADIDRLEAALPPLKHFILPGGSPAGATLHVARTICRRAERLTVALADREPVNPDAVVFLNRLSDFLFVAARWINARQGKEETRWTP